MYKSKGQHWKIHQVAKMRAVWIFFMLSLVRGRTLDRNISSKCLEDSIEFLEDLQSETPEEYALLMYDSIGKEGSNILHGNVDQLGSYSECTSAQASSGNFSGQYCKFTIQQGKIEYTVAICVPSSCKKDDILMLEWLGIFTYKNKSFIGPSQILSFISANATYRVKSVHCQNNTPYIDVFVGICIFVVALFITMMIAGSIYVTIKEWKSTGKMMEDDLSPPHKNYKTISVSKINGHQLQESSAKSKHQSSGHGVTEGKNNKVGFLEWMLTSFAIQKTVPAVLSTQITAGSYSAIHGIRVLSLLWIISGHVCHFTLLNNLVARPPPRPESLGELKKLQLSGQSSRSGARLPGLSQVSVISRKSNPRAVKKSLRMKVLFSTDLALIRATFAGELWSDSGPNPYIHQEPSEDRTVSEALSEAQSEAQSGAQSGVQSGVLSGASDEDLDDRGSALSGAQSRASSGGRSGASDEDLNDRGLDV
ncbi:O-acyltransferase like protein-like [Amblyraja radiata]|uniref:O-acyltransferase like protein-like n=1 Tax=Amblyraja radiata TaxID=386614 RepID=UPI001402C72D|nr:O-acyltransferase like protein-like [Amblyraja radiata]